jgi:hypothetical protein
MKDLKSINGVEIFSVGKWNGDNYTENDLKEMVQAFNDTKDGVRPFLKLGHDNKQKLVQEDGLPAIGWVNKIYIKNKKLYADFIDIPSKIYALIEARAYRKVSSEIFWNISIGEKTYKRMLSAVALLGADTPGVMNLNDILAMYTHTKNNYEKLSAIDAFELNFLNENRKDYSVEKSEKEIELEKELELKKLDAEKLEAEKKIEDEKKLELEKEIQELKEFKKLALEKEALQEAEKEALKIKNFIAELKAESLCSPAMETILEEILGPDKKVYTAKNLSKQESIKEVLKLFVASKEVNFAENSSKGKKDGENMELEMDKKAKEYAEKNKCSYSQALKQIMKEKK